jgi:hypothetical protein
VYVPELSRFFGITIRMFAEAGGSHHLPHFHVRYQDDEAVFRIEPFELIGGSIPARQASLVRTWATIHDAELRANWARLQLGEAPTPIKPLRLHR